MSVTEIIEAGGILVCQPCGTFERAVGALVGSLIDHGRLSEALREEAVSAVCVRESMANTAIVEIGVSIPHARLAGVEGVIAALAVSPTAVYQAMASVPISIVALVLSAPERVTEHLNVLAGLSILLQSQSVRRSLQEATDPAAALAILRRT
jgi:mannitol/fructose-specific phosphotransferase system IIA component (Ntr-type)